MFQEQDYKHNQLIRGNMISREECCKYLTPLKLLEIEKWRLAVKAAYEVELVRRKDSKYKLARDLIPKEASKLHIYPLHVRSGERNLSIAFREVKSAGLSKDNIKQFKASLSAPRLPRQLHKVPFSFLRKRYAVSSVNQTSLEKRFYEIGRSSSSLKSLWTPPNIYEPLSELLRQKNTSDCFSKVPVTGFPAVPEYKCIL